MKFGIHFPANDIGTDVSTVRDFATRAEAAGFDYLSTFEHVLGAPAERFEGVDVPAFGRPPYLETSQFHEPLTLYSYLSAITSRLEFVTGVLVLPQRQAVLVAKQVAGLDLLSGGRFILGVGIGWNHAEYEGLGEPFKNRASRLEEQIEVMRRLWSEPLVSYKGRFHQLDRVGINPLPNRLIPVWMGGGTSEPVMKRIARLGDGWIPSIPGQADPKPLFQQMHEYLAEAGRPVESLSVEASVNTATDPEVWLRRAVTMTGLGVSHLRINAPWSEPGKTIELAQDALRRVESEIGASA